MTTGKEIILQKLDAFTRKYYKNKLLRGLIWFTAGAVSLFFLTSFLEYIGRFNTTVRTGLFFAFLIFSLAILFKYVVVPVLQLYRLGNRIDHKQAAVIIGKHFPEIKDKLLNTLQLEESEAAQHNELLRAAIRQKTEQLRPIPFQQAVDLRSNVRYLKYALIPLAVLFLVILVAPGFSDSTRRIVQYNEEFIPQAPFRFVLDESDLKAVQNEDYTLTLRTEGEVIPSEVYVELEGYPFKMKSRSPGEFVHTIKRLSDDVNLRFEAEGFLSEWFTLDVLARPALLDFKAFLDYPDYTALTDEKLDNAVDLQVPAGTKIRWEFNARNAQYMDVIADSEIKKVPRKEDMYSLDLQFLDNKRVRVRTGNDNIPKGDSLEFNVQVIPDNFPQITMEEKADSSRTKIKYLLGEIRDDYGFSKLLFKYRFLKSDDEAKVQAGEKSEVMHINRGSNVQSYYHYWNLSDLNIQASDKIEYYFEVWDNDRVNGAKSARSKSQIFEAPSLDDLNALTEKTNEEIKSDIKDSKKSINAMNRELEDLERKMTEKKQLTWEEKKKVKELLEDHKKLQQDMQNILDQNKLNNTRESEFKQLDEEIAQKQEELQDLFEKVMDEEMKELMEQIEELMQQNKKDELMEKLDELDFSDKEISKQMDRMLEQLKQLQLEKKVNETVEKLDKLAKKQKELSEETKNKENAKEELDKKQEELNKEFDKVKKDIDDIEKKNKDLERPLPLDTEKPKDKHEEVQKDLKESQKDLGKNKRDDASQKQEDAADGMKEMSQDLQEQMEQAMQQQEGEDYNTLREILENLVQVSKDQEDLMEEFKTTRNYNPRYVEMGQIQKKIKDDTRMIEDSLFSLSKRVKQIEHFINKEIGKVNEHMDKTMAELGERRTNKVVMNQQYVMTSLNNLALMLSESLEQMQQQMQSNKQGAGSCKNPGSNQKSGSGQKMKSLRQMQESLKKQLEEMNQGMKQGGQGKPGSKEFAEAAAMQAAIRKKLRDIKAQLEKEGKGKKLGNLGQTEQLMDDLEQDLYNKRLSQQVLERQQEILTRLLEHEKAEREQEKDEQRKSKEGQEFQRELPPSIEEYLKQKEKEQELLRSLPPDLNSYYKQKVREYFNAINR